MVDIDRVRRMLEFLNTYRDRLAVLRSLPLEEYQVEHAFEGRYLVQAAAQVCIDIAGHVISSEGWRVPRDFRDTFTILEENKVIDPDLAGRLRELTGLRNRLVHLYADVDDPLIHHGLEQGLADFDAFIGAIAGLVAE